MLAGLFNAVEPPSSPHAHALQANIGYPNFRGPPDTASLGMLAVPDTYQQHCARVMERVPESQPLQVHHQQMREHQLQAMAAQPGGGMQSLVQHEVNQQLAATLPSLHRQPAAPPLQLIIQNTASSNSAVSNAAPSPEPPTPDRKSVVERV